MGKDEVGNVASTITDGCRESCWRRNMKEQHEGTNMCGAVGKSRKWPVPVPESARFVFLSFSQLLLHQLQGLQESLSP